MGSVQVRVSFPSPHSASQTQLLQTPSFLHSDDPAGLYHPSGQGKHALSFSNSPARQSEHDVSVSELTDPEGQVKHAELGALGSYPASH